jgi:hypothetical protein
MLVWLAITEILPFIPPQYVPHNGVVHAIVGIVGNIISRLNGNNTPFQVPGVVPKPTATGD